MNEVTCKKCGLTGPKIFLYDPGSKEFARFYEVRSGIFNQNSRMEKVVIVPEEKECLRFNCIHCGYKWAEPCADSK